MSLLFDGQRSPNLAAVFADTFPGARHVHDLGLGQADHRDIFTFAREHGFTIVTKDCDFVDLAALHGTPPKIVWIRLGNCSTDDVARLLRSEADTLRGFLAAPEFSVLSLA